MKCWNMNKHPILYPTRAADRAVIRNSIPFDVPAGYELPAAMKYLVLLWQLVEEERNKQYKLELLAVKV